MYQSEVGSTISPMNDKNYTIWNLTYIYMCKHNLSDNDTNKHGNLEGTKLMSPIPRKITTAI